MLKWLEEEERITKDDVLSLLLSPPSQPEHSGKREGEKFVLKMPKSVRE